MGAAAHVRHNRPLTTVAPVIPVAVRSLVRQEHFEVADGAFRDVERVEVDVIGVLDGG